MTVQALRIVVEVDPALAADLSPDLAERLARGVLVSTCYRGVRIDGLPGSAARGVVFPSSTAAVQHLHDLAELASRLVSLNGIGQTATGRWLLDRAAFLRLVARELVERRGTLWPGEVDET